MVDTTSRDRFRKAPWQLALARRIAAARRLAGLTQREVADRTGVEVRQVKRWESGNSEPTATMLGRLASSLQTTTDQLLRGTP